MESILVLLIPFPLGFFLANRTMAVLAYIAAFGPLFTFQTLSLITDWAAGSTAAFGGPFPASDSAQIASYGVVNLILYLAGFGLILLGHRLGTNRRARRESRRTVSLDSIS